jgi:hypothetical protein
MALLLRLWLICGELFFGGFFASSFALSGCFLGSALFSDLLWLS